MIVTCSNCTTRLQLEDAKIPSRAFTVRCPKCQFIINAQPAGSTADGSALAVAGDMPASSRQRESKPSSASSNQVEQSVEVSGKMPSAPSTNESEVARLLATLLQQGLAEGAASKTEGGRRWRQRRALICTGRAHREATARLLSQNQYEIFIADDTGQAIERMREEQMDVVILDPDFDAMEQGAAFINREINSLRPAQRRRVFFVHLLPNVRTADPHAAFLHHVNLVINPEDIEDLPRVLERAIRTLNELYRDFNKALNVAEL